MYDCLAMLLYIIERKFSLEINCKSLNTMLEWRIHNKSFFLEDVLIVH